MSGERSEGSRVTGMADGSQLSWLMGRPRPRVRGPEDLR